ncbi:Unannotated [Lentimonas sp. CC19]|nr:Unannotated [Lentimonas sp. CC4]CAA6685482.1 Unannotated [Lentimonas sp. CC6]CAA6690533.1 Unannotated [Lentimonas sp. CC10]CAA6693298.1 Unannotated [Lentimonas sp. CC19]CAA7068790.1 Unannotated [Lentimonas sp. CC11]CAA7170481.1 Unannotated [Lentimonas sp. CC21]CAA7179823.1 Unannotated [Lentimonas sp. CC8]
MKVVVRQGRNVGTYKSCLAQGTSVGLWGQASELSLADLNFPDMS